MPETDKFEVFKYEIYVLAVLIKGIAIIYLKNIYNFKLLNISI